MRTKPQKAHYKTMMAKRKPPRPGQPPGNTSTTPAGRKRQPSNTPYTTSWPRNSPDILDKLKALVLRFIDWYNNLPDPPHPYDTMVDAPPPAYYDDKHIADGEHMATLGELFDEVEEVAKPKPPRPHQPPGNTSTARQGAWPALWTSVTVTTKSTDKE